MVSRRKLVGFLAAAVGIVLVVVLLSFVPDWEAQFFDVRFVNDTGAVVLLGLCDERCGKPRESKELAPGEETTDEISDRAVTTRWLVGTRSGRVLGCITRSYDRKVPNLRIPLSAAKPCRVER